MHHKIIIDEEDHKKRPEIIKFYNKPKTGVNLVSQMVGTYTCRRQTRRWPLKLFFNLLNVAALNAYTIYRQVRPEQQSTGGSRRHFPEVESRTQGSRPRPRTQKKSETKAKDSFSEDRHSRGQGQECSRTRPRTKVTSASALQKKKKKEKGLHKNYSSDLKKKNVFHKNF